MYKNLIHVKGTTKMYDDLIKKINPSPNFITTWYEGEDKYSEGEIEDKIIQLIATAPSDDYTDTIYQNFSWSTYYHLSHIRQNILNWYPFDKNADLLEIGCGMGAITGMLCDRVSNVTAVEMSKKRATAALLRCKEKSNLDIIVGNLNDIQFNKQFDYITLIGVLEYQGSYTSSENPYLDFLSNIKSLLKPSGKLLVAIENQFGLKYWCAAPEDHTGIPFDGINSYSLTNPNVKTFSKNGLYNLLSDAGFYNTYFYYPMPDYKLPTVIYSQDKLPENGNMQNMSPYYTNKSSLVINEKNLWNDIVDNNVFEFFANSFLVECAISDYNDVSNRVVFSSMSTARKPQYRIGTRFIGTHAVEKFIPNISAGDNHLKTLTKNEDSLTSAGINVLKGTRRDHLLKYNYIASTLLENKMLSLLLNDNLESAYSLFDKIYAEITKSSTHVSPEENIIFTFGLDVPTDTTLYGPILETGYLDMILRNAFIDSNNELLWFDQEWTLENTPASFVLFRLIKEFWISFPKIEGHLSINNIVSRYNLGPVWKTYSDVESLFLGAVIDQNHLEESATFSYKESDKQIIINNIKKLINA